MKTAGRLFRAFFSNSRSGKDLPDLFLVPDTVPGTIGCYVLKLVPSHAMAPVMVLTVAGTDMAPWEVDILSQAPAGNCPDEESLAIAVYVRPHRATWLVRKG